MENGKGSWKKEENHPAPQISKLKRSEVFRLPHGLVVNNQDKALRARDVSEQIHDNPAPKSQPFITYMENV